MSFRREKPNRIVSNGPVKIHCPVCGADYDEGEVSHPTPVGIMSRPVIRSVVSFTDGSTAVELEKECAKCGARLKQFYPLT